MKNCGSVLRRFLQEKEIRSKSVRRRAKTGPGYLSSPSELAVNSQTLTRPHTGLWNWFVLFVGFLGWWKPFKALTKVVKGVKGEGGRSKSEQWWEGWGWVAETTQPQQQQNALRLRNLAPQKIEQVRAKFLRKKCLPFCVLRDPDEMKRIVWFEAKNGRIWKVWTKKIYKDCRQSC